MKTAVRREKVAHFSPSLPHLDNITASLKVESSTKAQKHELHKEKIGGKDSEDPVKVESNALHNVIYISSKLFFKWIMDMVFFV